MDHQNNVDAACVAWARFLLAAAALGDERLESAAQASCPLVALAGMLARLEGLSGPSASETGEAAALGAAGSEQSNGAPAAPAASSPEELARQRTRRGLAPPREIYDIRNRHRVDWSTLPEWAIAPDPDIFEGCAHEG